MKDYIIKLVIFFVVVAVFFKLAGNIPLSLNTKSLDKDNTFFVSSESSTFVKPDTASVSLSVEVNANTAAAAQNELNKAINNVTEEVKKLGVSAENIKTTNYNIYPTYATDGKRIDAYRASASVRVKDKDFDKVNKAMDKAVEAGANQIGGISFEVENKDEAINKARSEAIKKAKEKAQKIASEAGIRLGRIVNVSEYYPGDFPISAMADAFGKGAGGGGNATEVQPGQTEIKVNVTLSYETL